MIDGVGVRELDIVSHANPIRLAKNFFVDEFGDIHLPDDVLLHVMKAHLYC